MFRSYCASLFKFPHNSGNLSAHVNNVYKPRHIREEFALTTGSSLPPWTDMHPRPRRGIHNNDHCTPRPSTQLISQMQPTSWTSVNSRNAPPPPPSTPPHPPTHIPTLLSFTSSPSNRSHLPLWSTFARNSRAGRLWRGQRDQRVMRHQLSLALRVRELHARSHRFLIPSACAQICMRMWASSCCMVSGCGVGGDGACCQRRWIGRWVGR